jgi:hypothetical protein
MSWAGVEAGAKIFVGLMGVRREAAEAALTAQSIAATSCAEERMQDLQVLVLLVRLTNKKTRADANVCRTLSQLWQLLLKEADLVALPRSA